MVEKKKKPADDTRAKFLAALEKKKQISEAGSNVGPVTGTNSADGQGSGEAAKRIQRKSGMA
jgi:hypothetical protein